MTTCTVSFTARSAAGAILPGAKLVFTSLDAQIRKVGSWTVPGDVSEATADGAGDGSLGLTPGRYALQMISALGERVAVVTVPNAASARLEELIDAPADTIYSAIQLAVLAAGGRGLYESQTLGRAAVSEGDLFLAPLVPAGVGIYRKDNAGSSPKLGEFFTGETTASPTDTTADRLLKVGDFGFGRDTAITTTDWNSATISGAIYTGFNAANSPISNWVVGVYHRHNASYGVQTVRGFASPGTYNREFRRTFYNGVWTAWVEVYSQNNIVGTVGQLGGVPTGAIIEKGSNANGDYVRFADGTQICALSISISLAIATAFVGGFRTVSQSWTFPAVFAAQPKVTAAPAAFTALGVTLGTLAAGSAQWAATAVTSQADATRNVQLMAFGRWY